MDLLRLNTLGGIKTTFLTRKGLSSPSFFQGSPPLPGKEGVIFFLFRFLFPFFVGGGGGGGVDGAKVFLDSACFN